MRADLNRRGLLGAAVASCGGSAWAQAPGASVRHHGVVLRTPSWDAALGFFGDGLGMALAEFEPRAGWARLACNLPLYLEAAATGALPAPEASGVEITFRANNLEASTSALRAAGARILSEQPYEVAVGSAIRFADNAGVVHHLLQTSRESPLFAEPRVYNTGFEVPQAAVAPTRVLLEQGFGFRALSERYFPPSIPYLESDGESFAFMLHHNQPFEPDRLPRQARADDLGVAQVFVVDDLGAAARAATAHGAAALEPRPRRFPRGRRMAFATPGGAPFELWSWA